MHRGPLSPQVRLLGASSRRGGHGLPRRAKAAARWLALACIVTAVLTSLSGFLGGRIVFTALRLGDRVLRGHR